MANRQRSFRPSQQRLSAEILLQYIQFEFFRQWSELSAMPMRGIQIWRHPDLRRSIALMCGRIRKSLPRSRNKRSGTDGGSTPDYFSATGQLWGNPVYNWKLQQLDFQWWVQR